MLEEFVAPKIFSPQVVSFSAKFQLSKFQSEGQENLGISIPSEIASSPKMKQAQFMGEKILKQKCLEGLTHLESIKPHIWKKNKEIFTPGLVSGTALYGNVITVAITRKSHLGGLGIDIEKLVGPNGLTLIESLVASPKEVYESRGHDPFSYFSLLYSAKKSIYQCLFPLSRVKIEFQEMEIFNIDWDKGTFDFSFPKQIPFEEQNFQGRFFIDSDELIHTSVEKRLQ